MSFKEDATFHSSATIIAAECFTLTEYAFPTWKIGNYGNFNVTLIIQGNWGSPFVPLKNAD